MPQLTLRKKSTGGFINAGNYENVKYTYETESEDIWSPQTPERSKIATITTQTDVGLSFTLQQQPDLLHAIAMQSDPELKLEQAATVAPQTFVIPDAEAGKIYKLPHRAITAFTVAAGEVEYVHEVSLLDRHVPAPTTASS